MIYIYIYDISYIYNIRYHIYMISYIYIIYDISFIYVYIKYIYIIISDIILVNMSVCSGQGLIAKLNKGKADKERLRNAGNFFRMGSSNLFVRKKCSLQPHESRTMLLICRENAARLAR